MNYAFFDVDNTIYNGYTGTDLIDFLTENGLTDDSARTDYLKGVEQYQTRQIDYAQISQIALNAVSQAIRKCPVEEAEFMVDRMLSEKKIIFNIWVKPTIEFLKSKNYSIYLISSGPDLIIKQIAQMIGADGWYATTITHSNGIYLGHNPILLNDTAKVDAIKKLIQTNNVFSIAFGNSPGDAAMLDCVDKGFVLSNDHHPEIIEIAKTKNWVVFETTQEIIDELS